MSNGFTIPHHFVADDEMSSTVAALKAKMDDLGRAGDHAFDRTTRSAGRSKGMLSDLQRQVLGLVGAGALIAGGMQLGRFSFDEAAGYEEAVDSFRTIVSDLNDAEFSKFQDAIDNVATNSKRSGKEVAQAFEKVAGLNASFAETAEGISDVTAASITLAKASKMETGPAAENLVGIMNQFSLGASEANRAVNVLAAGQAVGAANISQTAEAFVSVGAVAAGANLSLEQSTALIQTLGKYSLFGAEAGTKLRGAILRLQKAGVGYQSGQFNMNDALNQTNTILGKLRTAKEKDFFLNKLFGAENVTAGRILANNVDLYNKFTQEVTGTSEAQKAAAINSGNLKAAIGELGAGWVNMITGSAESKQQLTQLTDAVRWTTAHLGDIVEVGGSVLKMFLLWKGATLSYNAVMAVSNIRLGIQNALQLQNIAALQGNTIAKTASIITEKAFAATIALSTGNLRAFNTALGLTPLGWAVAGVTALAAGVYLLSERQKRLAEQYQADLAQEKVTQIRQETDELKKLIAEYWHLGMSIRDATAAGLERRAVENDTKVHVAKSRLSETKQQLAGSMNKFHISDMLPTGASAVMNLFGERGDLSSQAAAQQSVLRKAENATEGDKQFAQSQLEKGMISQEQFDKMYGVSKPRMDESNPWVQEQRASEQASAFRIYEQGKGVKQDPVNVEVTIKNLTDHSIDVQKGGRQLPSVKPPAHSTKI